ncbi:MAG: alpha/beta fold hydrolase, partial [Gemmatimonadota bacterium]|nr:alpha/beta fold hydrolase [Gemmatimonadota bacterium]
HAQEADRAEPEVVRFENGDLELAGLWFVPSGEGPFPAAVFIRGSGPSSRDSYWARAIADVFLDEGVAVLLPDKRGSDGSGGDWRTADFEDLAGDALAAVDYVRGRAEVRGDRVGLVGLSQGGKIAPVAASRAGDRVAFVVDFVGAATTLVEQLSWEMFHTFREEGLEGQALQEALRLQVAAEKLVRGEYDWGEYERVLTAALASPWAEVAEDFPTSPDSWRWDFARRVIDFDPLPYWREVTQPVLVFYGEDDHNAPSVRSVYRLTRAFMEEDHPDWTIRVYPDAGHPLWNPESEDPHRPELHPDLVELLETWLGRVTEAVGGP